MNKYDVSPGSYQRTCRTTPAMDGGWQSSHVADTWRRIDQTIQRARDAMVQNREAMEHLVRVYRMAHEEQMEDLRRLVGRFA